MTPCTWKMILKNEYTFSLYEIYYSTPNLVEISRTTIAIVLKLKFLSFFIFLNFLIENYNRYFRCLAFEKCLRWLQIINRNYSYWEKKISICKDSDYAKWLLCLENDLQSIEMMKLHEKPIFIPVLPLYLILQEF